MLGFSGAAAAVVRAFTQSGREDAQFPFVRAPLVGLAPGTPLLNTVEGNERYSFFVAAYPATSLQRAEAVYPESSLRLMRDGVIGLSRRCPRHGDPLVFCESSKWFECLTHGSFFNEAGEYKAGPSPRGMSLLSGTMSGEDEILLNVGVLEPGYGKVRTQRVKSLTAPIASATGGRPEPQLGLGRSSWPVASGA